MVASGIYSGTCTYAHAHHTHTYMHAHTHAHTHTGNEIKQRWFVFRSVTRRGMIGGRYEKLFIGDVKSYMESLLFLEHSRKPKLLVKGRDNRFRGLHWITWGFVLCWNPGLSKSVHLVTSICHRFNYRLWMKEWEPEQRDVARLSLKSHPFSSWMAWILAKRMSLK